MEEIWRDIPDYEGLYQVSNMGRVKSLNYNHTGKEKILKPRTDKDGYLYVGLHKNGKQKMYKVHRLVLMTFSPVENMENLEVDHIDTNPSNNNLENLRWTTRKENCNNLLSKVHYSESKKGENNPWYEKFGVKHPKSIPVVQLTLDGKLVNVYGSSMEAERNGFDRWYVGSCCRGERKTHGGYEWCYLYEYIANIHPNIKQINLMGKQYNVNQEGE